MDRRTALKTIVAVTSLLLAPRAFGQADSFEALLGELSSDPSLVENSWKLSFHQHNVDRSVGTGTPSTRKISAKAIDMITRLEVSSRLRYEQKYMRPIWPGNRSGVTLGIGYDLRFATDEYLKRDWGGLLSEEMIAKLLPVLQLGGVDAKDALPNVQEVVVPWDAAVQQFEAFLPYPTADAEEIFPNSNKLSDDSFGALVSLVYNRGASLANSSRRREMRKIHQLMVDQKFDDIPEQIRSMKRLWPAENERGLVVRRELEAQLFEIGMA